jgi:acyl carrier protein
VASEGLTRADLLAKVRDILAEVIDDDSLQLSETSTAEDVADWDSINHVKLLIGLESDLGFRFETDEVTGLSNVGELINVIEKKLS